MINVSKILLVENVKKKLVPERSMYIRPNPEMVYI